MVEINTIVFILICIFAAIGVLGIITIIVLGRNNTFGKGT